MKVNVGHPLLGFLLSSTAEQVFVETHCLLTVVYKLGKDFLQRWHISSRNQQSLYYERPLPIQIFIISMWLSLHLSSKISARGDYCIQKGMIWHGQNMLKLEINHILQIIRSHKSIIWLLCKQLPYNPHWTLTPALSWLERSRGDCRSTRQAKMAASPVFLKNISKTCGVDLFFDRRFTWSRTRWGCSSGEHCLPQNFSDLSQKGD